mgnify:CR=1 FL=1
MPVPSITAQARGPARLLRWGSAEKDVMRTSAMFGLQAVSPLHCASAPAFLLATRPSRFPQPARRHPPSTESHAPSLLLPLHCTPALVIGGCAAAAHQAEKLALGEGSKLVMAAVESRYNQGVYGLVANLGGLVVRVVFQPLEEAAFVAFSTWQGSADAAAGDGASGSAGASKKGGDAGASGSSSDSAKAGQRGEHLERLSGALVALTKGVSLLGLLAVAFGPAYSYTALRLVYGLKWSETEAPRVLAVYCAYILLLALNGEQGLLDASYRALLCLAS